MFRQDTDESFQTAKQSSMDHDGALIPLVCSSILKLETFWKLEVELDGGALKFTLQGVTERDVDFWSVELRAGELVLSIPACRTR